MAYQETVRNGLTLTRENFFRPPMEMGILPFWFWNGEMDEKEMEWQLREYKQKGIHSLFIHGRFGLKVPYVSDGWFEKVKAAVALAKTIGIDAWVYDEMNWPSGTAERKVPTQYPHLRQQYLELVALNVDGPLFTFLEATDNRYVNTGDSYPIAAFGCTEEEFQTEIRNPLDLTQNLSFEKVLPWEAPPGKWRLLYFLQKEIPYYIDTLNPESTRRFIELTHDRYAHTVGSDLGSCVPGFYTDEPAMHYYHVGIDNYVVPWTGQMFRIFRDKRGYDLRPVLPALYLNMGPQTARIRYDFWRTLTEQYAETYFGQIRSWCERNGVLFTGHLLFEEWLRMHARCEGNLFKYLEKMHIIGVDHLYPKIGTPEEPDQHVSLKVASSAAHHFGSTRLLCESMGGAYWDCTLQRMRWIANWEYVLGVNLFNNHGYHYSIEGERKRDWPPSQFYHHTWWKHYAHFTTYMARMSHLLSGGTHVAKVLMLYPLSSIWTNYVPQARNDIGDLIEADFTYLTDTLLRLHYDFDYVEEDVLAGATVQGGTITIRDESYSVLLLPPVTHIKISTLDVIERFIRGGGTVIADTLLPSDLLESPANNARRRVQKVFGVSPDALMKHFHSTASDRTVVLTRRGKGTVYVLKGKGLHRSRPKAMLRKLLERCGPPDVTISEEDVFYLHRIKDGFDIYYFVNTAQSAKLGVAVTFEQAGIPEVWDLETGTTKEMPLYSMEKGRLRITLDFAPAGARVVVIRKGEQKPHVTSSSVPVESFDGKTIHAHALPGTMAVTVVVGGGNRSKRITARRKAPLKPLSLPWDWEFHPDGDNALLLGSFRMALDAGGGSGEEAIAPGFDDSGWLTVKPGAWEMQLPQERAVAEYPAKVWYRATFDAAFVPEDLRILIDGFSGGDHTLFVNGVEVHDRGQRSALDAEIREIPIAGLVNEGRNLLCIRLTVTRRTDGILDPLKLIGAFALEKTGTGYRIVRHPGRIAVGDWTAQGYPFFSGTGMYQAEFELPESYAGGKLFLDVECGEDVLEVSLNGAESIVVPWPPYHLDVSDLVRPGRNLVNLKVTNTLINVLEGVPRASGVLTRPRLVHSHRYVLSV
jgi:hypothetical protein